MLHVRSFGLLWTVQQVFSAHEIFLFDKWADLTSQNSRLDFPNTMIFEIQDANEYLLEDILTIAISYEAINFDNLNKI